MALSPKARLLVEDASRQANRDRDAIAGGREHANNPKRWAAEAPPSRDPSICRWCGGTLRALYEGAPRTFCQSGCSIEPVFTGHCDECKREFKTGLPLISAVLCHECTERERAQAGAAYRQDMSVNARLQRARER
jgi:hypothetical protein